MNIKDTALRAESSKPFDWLVRAGFIAYGVVHILIAWLALQIAFGNNKKSDQGGAFQTIAQAPLGKVLLIIIAVGLLAMAIWQEFAAIRGYQHFYGVRKALERIGAGCRVVVYAALCFGAVKTVFISPTDPAKNQQKATSTILSVSGGRWVVGLVGLIVIAVGIGMIIYGLMLSFRDNLKGSGPATGKTILTLGLLGYSAKGLAYGIVGWLLVQAAWTYDSKKSRGLDAALHELAQHTLGRVLLILIALGFAAFGVFCFFQAKYRKV